MAEQLYSSSQLPVSTWFILSAMRCLLICRPFLETLSTTFVIVTLFPVLMFVMFAMSLAARDQLCYLDCTSSSNCTECPLRLFGAKVPDIVFPVVAGIIIVPSVIVDALLGHLLGFHIYFSELETF